MAYQQSIPLQQSDTPPKDTLGKVNIGRATLVWEHADLNGSAPFYPFRYNDHTDLEEKIVYANRVLDIAEMKDVEGDYVFNQKSFIEVGECAIDSLKALVSGSFCFTIDQYLSPHARYHIKKIAHLEIPGETEPYAELHGQLAQSCEGGLVLASSTEKLPLSVFHGFIVDQTFHAGNMYIYIVRKPYHKRFKEFYIQEVSSNQELSAYYRMIRKSTQIPDILPEIYWDRHSYLYLAYDQKNTPVGCLRLIPKRRVALPVEFAVSAKVDVPCETLEISHLIVDLEKPMRAKSMSLTTLLFSVALDETIRNNCDSMMICVQQNHCKLYQRIGFIETQKDVRFNGFEESFVAMNLNVRDALVSQKNSYQKMILEASLHTQNDIVIELHDEMINSFPLYKKTFVDDTILVVRKLVETQTIPSCPKILEVPTFAGNITKSMVEFGPVTSLDLSPSSKIAAMKKSDGRIRCSLTAHTMDITDKRAVDILSKEYDALVITNILYAIKHPQQALLNLLSKVHTQGYVIITELHAKSLVPGCIEEGIFPDRTTTAGFNRWKQWNDLLNELNGVNQIIDPGEIAHHLVSQGFAIRQEQSLFQGFAIRQEQSLFQGFAYRIIAQRIVDS